MAFLAGTLAGGNVVSQGLRLVGGVLQARWVPPLVMGQFNSIGQILGYLPFLQLGIFNGLNRELPYFVGKQEHQRVRDLAAAAQAWALLLGLASGAVLLAIGAWELAHGRVMWAAGWAANAVLAFLLFYSVNYLNMTFRTGHEFARLAVIGVVESAVGLLLVGLIVVLSWFGMTFYGICLRLAIAGTISAAMLHHWRPVRVAPRWDFFQLKHLLVIGFPIFLVGQLYAWWVPLNNTVVWFCAGDLGLGLYAMVLTANTALEAIPQALGQVLYPRMAEHFGRHERPRDLIAMAMKPTLATVFGMAAIALAAWWLVEPVTRLVAPKYIAAVPAIRWSLLSPIVTSFNPVNSVFIVTRRLLSYGLAIALGMGVYAAAVYFLWPGHVAEKMLPQALTAFPKAMLLGRATFTAICWWLLFFASPQEDPPAETA